MMRERQVKKRAVNLFVDTELLDEARRLRINISGTLEHRCAASCGPSRKSAGWRTIASARLATVAEAAGIHDLPCARLPCALTLRIAASWRPRMLTRTHRRRSAPSICSSTPNCSTMPGGCSINLSDTLERRLRAIVKAEQEKRGWRRQSRRDRGLSTAASPSTDCSPTAPACCDLTANERQFDIVRQSVPAQPGAPAVPGRRCRATCCRAASIRLWSRRSSRASTRHVRATGSIRVIDVETANPSC